MESGYYPAGAGSDIKAPYNQLYLPEKEIEVTVSITLSKTVKIKVNDYDITEDIDEDGRDTSYYDYSNCDLKRAVKEQINLPQYICTDWDVDDYEVVLE